MLPSLALFGDGVTLMTLFCALVPRCRPRLRIKRNWRKVSFSWEIIADNLSKRGWSWAAFQREGTLPHQFFLKRNTPASKGRGFLTEWLLYLRWQPQSDRITPVIRTDMIESPWPPYVAE